MNSPALSLITMVAGALLSVLGLFVPWFSDPTLPDNVKALRMFLVNIGVAALVIVAGCYNWYPIEGFVCDVTSIFDIIIAIVSGVVGNQGTFSLVKNFRPTQLPKG